MTQTDKASAPALQTQLMPLLKLILTCVALSLLLTHKISLDGETTSVLHAIRSRLGHLSWQQLAPYLLGAIAIKLVGVGCAIWRWQLLLEGQGICFLWRHTTATFMIGRFFGIFLPGTLGLDGYKALDITRATGRIAETVAATAVEKLMGLAGMALVFASTAYAGQSVLGDEAPWVLGICVPVAVGIVGLCVWGLWQPRRLTAVIASLSRFAPPRLGQALAQMARAMAAYEGQSKRLGLVLALSFWVHWTTASVYVLTAQAVGAPNALWGPVIFASSIQILATVLSPFTVAGEGVREVVSALLLAKSLGLTNSIVSAALGFWVAEAVPTLVGGVLWWLRPTDYTPQMTLDAAQRAAPPGRLDA